MNCSQSRKVFLYSCFGATRLRSAAGVWIHRSSASEQGFLSFLFQVSSSEKSDSRNSFRPKQRKPEERLFRTGLVPTCAIWSNWWAEHYGSDGRQSRTSVWSLTGHRQLDFTRLMPSTVSAASQVTLRVFHRCGAEASAVWRCCKQSSNFHILTLLYGPCIKMWDYTSAEQRSRIILGFLRFSVVFTFLQKCSSLIMQWWIMWIL